MFFRFRGSLETFNLSPAWANANNSPPRRPRLFPTIKKKVSWISECSGWMMTHKLQCSLTSVFSFYYCCIRRSRRWSGAHITNKIIYSEIRMTFSFLLIVANGCGRSGSGILEAIGTKVTEYFLKGSAWARVFDVSRPDHLRLLFVMTSKTNKQGDQ